MNIEATLQEKIKRFEAVKNQIAQVTKQIGGLTEQQRALYNQGLELKGSIDTLLSLHNEEKKALAASKTAGLTLPEGVKPVVAEAAPVETPALAAPAPAVATESVPEAPVAAAPLEVVK